MNTLLTLIGLGMAAYGASAALRGEVSLFTKGGDASATFSREEQPGRFWGSVALYLVLGLSLAALLQLTKR